MRLETTKIILIEGSDGSTIERVITEKANPYGGSGRKKHKYAKQRELLAKRTQRDAKGWVWTMGYNNCVGRFSGGVEYPRFSGSSLNRKKKPTKTDLDAVASRLIEVARKVARKMCRCVGWAVSGALRNLLRVSDQASKDEYSLWLQREIYGNVDGLSFGIHELSPRSRGKIKDKATAFYRACPGSRVFITLTFIAPTTDQSGVSILNKFMTVVRKEHKNVQFLWVAERQDNGNIHFHIIINKRLPVKRYNALWVLQQYNAGLVGRDQYGNKISMEDIEQRVEAGTVGKVLNPFDVKKIRSIGGLSSYLTKYITKQKKNQPFGCSVWHCSRGVSRLFVKAVVSPSAFRYCMSFNNAVVNKDTGECWAPEMIRGMFFLMVFINNKSAPLSYLKEMEQINKWMIEGLMPSDIPMLDDIKYSKYYLTENLN